MKLIVTVTVFVLLLLSSNNSHAQCRGGVCYPPSNQGFGFQIRQQEIQQYSWPQSSPYIINQQQPYYQQRFDFNFNQPPSRVRLRIRVRGWCN